MVDDILSIEIGGWEAEEEERERRAKLVDSRLGGNAQNALPVNMSKRQVVNYYYYYYYCYYYLSFINKYSEGT